MIRPDRFVFLLLILSTMQTATAYETQTHALMTAAAYDRSVLSQTGDTSVLSRLLLDRHLPSDPFKPYWTPSQPSTYFSDHTGGVASWDGPAAFERCQMQQFLTLPPARQRFQTLFETTVEYDNQPPLLNPRNWLVRGAIREDDTGNSLFGLLALRGSRCARLWLDTVGEQPGGIIRSLNHFYDPVHDIGLSTDLLLDGDQLVKGRKSVDWALGYVNSFTHPLQPAVGAARNTYSYIDARNAFWQALTFYTPTGEGSSGDELRRSSDSRTRLIYWATLFRSLGNVVHLLEDAAQPQHTRNDPHSAINTQEQQGFEAYTNARVLGGNDVGEFVRGFFVPGPLTLSVPQLGTYGVAQPVMFATPVQFFTTRNVNEPSFRAGLADYSNRGFFTGGTLPNVESGEYPHSEPPADVTDPQNEFSFKFAPCEVAFQIDPRLNTATCLYYTRPVVDRVDPGYAATLDSVSPGFALPKIPIASESVFKRLDLPDGFPPEVERMSMTMSPAVFDAIGNLTIPRAIGYASGFLDFFFRGAIEIASPPEGLYAILDQGTPHHVEDGMPMDDAGGVFGFKKLRVRIRNATMTDANGNPTLRDASTGEMVPQTMRAGVAASGSPTGHLVAIARYHRNPCYQRDLSGEYVTMPDPVTGIPDPEDVRVPNGCSLDESRSAFQEISVSAEIALDAAGELPGNPGGAVNPCVNVGNINTGTPDTGNDCESDFVLAQFDFSEYPIPINATDLFLQVAYRGPLGLEEDGIAVGMKDLIEPNYLSGWNSTDWFYLSGHFVPPAEYPQFPIGQAWRAAPISDLTICADGQTIGMLRAGLSIQPAEFFRIALISDGKQVELGIQDVFPRGGSFEAHTANFISRQFGREDINFPFAVPISYSPIAIPWYARGTPMGMVLKTGFYFYGEEDENRTMQALILQPAIGVGQAGIATPINADFDLPIERCVPVDPL